MANWPWTSRAWCAWWGRYFQERGHDGGLQEFTAPRRAEELIFGIFSRTVGPPSSVEGEANGGGKRSKEGQARKDE